MTKRFPEVIWHNRQQAKAPQADPLPIIKTYEENGITVKVYKAAGLQHEPSTTVRKNATSYHDSSYPAGYI